MERNYKLIKPEYHAAAFAIAYPDLTYYADKEIIFTETSKAHERLQTAGVLELWFAPADESEVDSHIRNMVDKFF